MILFQPTPDEISNLLNTAKAKWPELRTRIEKAEAILNNGLITLNDPTPREEAWDWQVQSQTRNLFYTLNPAANDRTCADPGIQIAGRTFCKHRIAMAAYRRITIQHLNRAIANADIELWTDVHGIHAQPCNPATHAFLVHRGNDGIYRPFDNTGLARLALWLTKRQERTTITWKELDSEPLFDQPWPPQEVKPRMSTAEYRHWLRTGDTPAMRSHW